jgi:hypothetical protein
VSFNLVVRSLLSTKYNKVPDNFRKIYANLQKYINLEQYKTELIQWRRIQVHANLHWCHVSPCLRTTVEMEGICKAQPEIVCEQTLYLIFDFFRGVYFVKSL